MCAVDLDTERNSLSDFVESILFDMGDKKRIDYRKLEADSPAYDVIYEKSVRRKCLNLIYILDEIRQEMGYTGSRCVDLLIEMERFLRLRKIHGMDIDDSVLQDLLVGLSDDVMAESDFVANRLSAWEYKIMKRKFRHLDPLSGKDEFICGLRKFAFNLQNSICAGFID
ncbi:hypothetical protein [Micavibrio aeruginosavorus]|uniref:hypothetical protein n=1 Tax=Micavibrio aeruginosavorus TaxID=349221 RepID=UPI0005A23FE5|nr:hypothetical protein [Micavibrio aeruginosavorus]